jgi:hypothetical protein
VELAELLVELDHLLRVWRRVVALLAVLALCYGVSKSFDWTLHNTTLDLPCVFRSLIVLVVAGPTKAMLARPVRKMVASGARTVHRLGASSTPAIPAGLPPDRLPGYVRARTTGMAVCIEK